MSLIGRSRPRESSTSVGKLTQKVNSPLAVSS